MKESISSLKTTFRQEMRTKLDVFQTNQKQVDTGLTTFDLNVTSVYFVFPFFDLLCFLQLLFVIHQCLRKRFFFMLCLLPQCRDHLLNMAVNHIKWWTIKAVSCTFTCFTFYSIQPQESYWFWYWSGDWNIQSQVCTCHWNNTISV
jgi:hypothetical protein